MNNDSDPQMDLCSELVTLRKTEPFLLTLLTEHGPGEWASVGEICRRIHFVSTEISPGLVSTWLPDPFGADDFIVIIFYDDETKRSLAANYNRCRLDAQHRTDRSSDGKTGTSGETGRENSGRENRKAEGGEGSNRHPSDVLSPDRRSDPIG